MSASSQTEGAKKQARSRLTNGSAILPSVDGRSIWARLLRDQQQALVQHLGGEDRVSETQRLVVRRVAAIETELIFLEDKIAAIRAEGGEPDPQTVDLYSRLANGQRRHLEILGWDRVPRDITPDLATYVRERYGQQEEPAE